MKSYDFAGKTVLITGGSMGIGEAFARELSARGARLLLVARSRDKLEALARDLPETQIIPIDLTERGAPERVLAEVQRRGIAVDVLINNAGFGAFGGFGDVPLATQLDLIDLNIHALVALTQLFLPMVEQRQGGVIQVASTAAFQPLPYLAVYAASKAFVLNFSEALWQEYRGRGVRVLALCPGATESQFFKRAGEAASFGKKADPVELVRLGLKAFGQNRPSVVHGTGNWFSSVSSRFFSRAMTVRITAAIMRPKSPPVVLPARAR